jgi:hypothetical protein
MTTEKYKARLTISERWDQNKSLFGLVEETNLSGVPELLFTSEHDVRYVLSLRYKESQNDEIWMGKHVIVNIVELIDSFDSKSLGGKFLFGGIELLEPGL